MAISSLTPPPHIYALPDSMPEDGAISIALQEGTPVFRASSSVQQRISSLLDKQKQGSLNPAETEELDRYELIDDYLSYLNRLVRNLSESYN